MVLKLTPSRFQRGQLHGESESTMAAAQIYEDSVDIVQSTFAGQPKHYRNDFNK